MLKLFLTAGGWQEGEAAVHNVEAVEDHPPEFPKETSVEMRCFDAFTAVAHFERTHCLALQVLLLSHARFPVKLSSRFPAGSTICNSIRIQQPCQSPDTSVAVKGSSLVCSFREIPAVLL